MFFSVFATATAYYLTDYLTSNLMLLLSEPAISVFIGWGMTKQLLQDEQHTGPRGARILGFLLCYVVPVTIACAALALLFTEQKL